MSGLRILVLAVLVAALGSWLYLVEIPQAQKDAQKEKLAGVAADDVTGIQLVYPDRTIVLAKGDKGWRLTQPVDAPADEAVVKPLLQAVTGAEVQKSLDELPKDLAPFGLDKPSTVITLTTKNGAQPAIQVGKNTSIGAKTYVRKGDEPKVYLTAGTIQTAINKQAKDVRDKTLLAIDDPEDVKRVEIAKPGAPTLTLSKNDKNEWTLDPGGVPADATEVRSYVSALRTTRATDFPDDAPADLGKYGLSAPRLTITVATGKGGDTTQQLLVGGESTGEQTKSIYVKRGNQPTVYAVGEWALRSLDKDAGALRDKTVLAFDADKVGRVVLERKDGTGATLVRAADGTWTVEGLDAKKVKGTAVQRFVDDLKDLKGSAVAAEPPPADLGPFGLAAPGLRLTVTDKDGKPIGVVLLSKQDAKYFTMREGGPSVFETRDYMYTRLDKQARDFEQGTTPSTVAPAAAPGPGVMPPMDLDQEDGGDEDEE